MTYNNLYLFNPKSQVNRMNPLYPTPYSPYTPMFKYSLLNKIAQDTGLVLDPLNRKVTALELEIFCLALIKHVREEERKL